MSIRYSLDAKRIAKYYKNLKVSLLVCIFEINLQKQKNFYLCNT